jgi:hypothetical protein
MRRLGLKRCAFTGALALALVGLVGVGPARAEVTLCTAGFNLCECGFFETCIPGHSCTSGVLGDRCKSPS